ncbi:MAG: hypothetical protein ABIJ12_13480 [bacterium]
MAVGGMIGGGIFSTLGVVIGIAGASTWLSFIAAGLVALAAGYSYVKLAAHYGEGGGTFTFLREISMLRDSPAAFHGYLSSDMYLQMPYMLSLFGSTLGMLWNWDLGSLVWLPSQ